MGLNDRENVVADWIHKDKRSFKGFSLSTG
jgi:hypothetical protein